MAAAPTTVTATPGPPGTAANAAWKAPINQTFNAARTAASTPGVGITDPAGLAAARTARQQAIQAAKPAGSAPMGNQPGVLQEQFPGGRANVPWPPAGGVPAGMSGAQAGGSFNMPAQGAFGAPGGGAFDASSGGMNTNNGGQYAGFSKGGAVGDTKPRYKGVIHKGRR